ncbi:MAG: hypothetical protein FWE62_04525, partial [Firmicutes bacterium]|nr:hypothetical protein [Bacillota bacterium]
PDAFISGFTYKLPPLTAVDYSGASPQPVAGVPSVTVNGAPQSIDANGNFKPVISGSDGTALITYNFTGGTGTHTENYTVPVVDVKTNVFMTDVSRYFVSDGFTKTAKSSFVSFAGSVSGATAGFIRPLSAENFSFTLYLAESGLNNMNYVDFTLTDKDSAGCAILLRLYPNDRISIGGGSTNAIYSDSVGGYKRMTINYSPSYNRFTDARGSLIGVPARTTAGAAFNGFSSGEVYLRFATGALTGGIEVGISAINGQPLTAGTLLDRTPPMVLLNPDLGGAKNIGDIVTVHAARACDVLSEVAWVRVSVIDNVTGAFIKGTDGVEIRNLDASRDYEFKIERPGVYRIRFTAADGAGNESLPIFKLIQAFDTIPPVITVNGTVPRTARLNSTVTVPGMTVTDNISSVDDPLSPLKSMVILFEPSGQQRIITNSFAATMSGVYIVRYFAWDADGNTTIRDFEITVS